MPDSNDDRVLWGAYATGEEAQVFRDDGTVDLAKTFRLLELGLLDGSKVGRLWQSTTGRIRAQLCTPRIRPESPSIQSEATDHPLKRRRIGGGRRHA